LDHFLELDASSIVLQRMVYWGRVCISQIVVPLGWGVISCWPSSICCVLPLLAVIYWLHTPLAGRSFTNHKCCVLLCAAWEIGTHCCWSISLLAEHCIAGQRITELGGLPQHLNKQQHYHHIPAPFLDNSCEQIWECSLAVCDPLGQLVWQFEGDSYGCACEVRVQLPTADFLIDFQRYSTHFNCNKFSHYYLIKVSLRMTIWLLRM